MSNVTWSQKSDFYVLILLKYNPYNILDRFCNHSLLMNRIILQTFCIHVDLILLRSSKGKGRLRSEVKFL